MSPKTGPRTAREAAWLKIVPRAIADGLTGGRSEGMKLAGIQCLATVRNGLKMQFGR